MTLLSYIAPGSLFGPIYRQQLLSSPGFDSAELFDSPELLALRLRRIGCESLVALVVSESRDDLERLQELCGLLTNMQLVLVVPDEEDSTLALGHSLRPRFLASPSTEPRQVLSVTQQVIQRQRDRTRINHRAA